MSGKPRSTIVPLAAGVSVLGVCCGLPLLASAGVLGAITGVGLGSWLIAAVATAVGLVGVVWWRRTAASCPAPVLGDDDSSLALHDMVRSPAQPTRPDPMRSPDE